MYADMNPQPRMLIINNSDPGSINISTPNTMIEVISYLQYIDYVPDVELIIYVFLLRQAKYSCKSLF